MAASRLEKNSGRENDPPSGDRPIKIAVGGGLMENQDATIVPTSKLCTLVAPVGIGADPPSPEITGDLAPMSAATPRKRSEAASLRRPLIGPVGVSSSVARSTDAESLMSAGSTNR